MCWPQTGHAYLNSLMADGWCFPEHPIFKTGLQPAFESDFSRHPAQLVWSSGFSLSANKLKLELQ
jgi:hypothetical protein